MTSKPHARIRGTMLFCRFMVPILAYSAVSAVIPRLLCFETTLEATKEHCQQRTGGKFREYQAFIHYCTTDTFDEFQVSNYVYTDIFVSSSPRCCWESWAANP